MGRPQRIYIISDWHLGGSCDEDCSKRTGLYGTQICRSADAIAGFVEWISNRAEGNGEEVELIVNGDMVDFLAPEPEWTPREWIADESIAAARLEQIAENCHRVARSPFDALRRLLAHGHTFTLLLGNHDVELSLPDVRRKLVELLGAQGRKFNFMYDGEACVRGRLLVEHGNRYDSFNSLDQSALRQERSHLSRGLPVDEKLRKSKFFLPPAGTMIVVHAINGLLAAHPYLNLLKPETKAALPLLVALRPELEPIFNFIVKAWQIRRRKGAGAMDSAATPRGAGYLAAPAAATSATYGSFDDVLAEMLSAEEAARVRESPPGGAGQLAAGDFTKGLLERVRTMFDAVKSKVQDAALLSELMLEPAEERRRILIRAAFRKLRADTSFALDAELPDYLDAARALLRGGRFSHVVFGHTHLPKELRIEREQYPPGVYLNCGTWADVIALPDNVGEEEAGAEAALKAFVDDLSARNLAPHLRRYLTYVEATVAAEGAVEAHLHSYCGAGGEQCPPLQPYLDEQR